MVKRTDFLDKTNKDIFKIVKAGCKEFRRWQDLGWIRWNKLDKMWEVDLSDSGACSYDMPIQFCPFCGKELKEDTAG